jgi:hypothetical protein
MWPLVPFNLYFLGILYKYHISCIVYNNYNAKTNISSFIKYDNKSNYRETLTSHNILEMEYLKMYIFYIAANRWHLKINGKFENV